MLGSDRLFLSFIDELNHSLNRPLPGADAHYTMVPPGRERINTERVEREQNPRKAGVLALFYPFQDQPHLVLMKRNAYAGVHSAQISFPGGQHEVHDADLVATALRETEEEIGVSVQQIHVVGKLSKVYIPPSNFLVQPVVGFVPYEPQFSPDAQEVSALLHIPFSDFLNPESVKQTSVEARGQTFHVPAYNIQSEIIWGATAMMIAELVAAYRS